jgi:hypothetical protein
MGAAPTPVDDREDLAGDEQPVGGDRDRNADDGAEEGVGGGIHAQIDPSQGEQGHQAGRDRLPSWRQRPTGTRV